MVHEGETRRMGYTNIPIPTILADSIDEVIRNSNLGYRTKTEFILQAIREKIDKVEGVQ